MIGSGSISGLVPLCHNLQSTEPSKAARVSTQYPSWSRYSLSLELAHRWNWRNAKRQLKDIAGHTHRPVFQNLSLTDKWYVEKGRYTLQTRRWSQRDSAYFNTGSCVHPRCITGIELTGTGEDMRISLIKWSAEPIREAGSTEGPSYPLTIRRTVLESTLLKPEGMAR